MMRPRRSAMTAEMIESMIGDGKTAMDFGGVTLQRVAGRGKHASWRVSAPGYVGHFLTCSAACARVADLLAGAA